jgi:hypothetical protein
MVELIYMEVWYIYIGMKRICEIIDGVNFVRGKTIVSVDIQPEYEKHISFNIGEYVEYINMVYSEVRDVVFLYNGADTLGMVSEGEYKEWLMGWGMDEGVMEGIRYYDKGYAWFRYCMDSYIDEEEIVNFVKFLVKKGVRDSREMTKELWKEYIKGEGRGVTREELVGLLEHSDDMVYIPELMEYMGSYNNIVMVGGGVNECLKEVEIALKALGKGYEIYKKFTY